MQKNCPSYRIKYLQCKEKGHAGQINNLVCLNKNCLEGSLICSFCKQQKHKDHVVQPLKHYLQNLSKQYRSTKSKINDELQQLQNQKQFLLIKLRQSVQEIAKRFMLLQQQIVTKYDIIKTQVLQKEFRRNNFQTFYRSMIAQNSGDPMFQIQNYLSVQPLQVFRNNNCIQNFTHMATQQLKNICLNLTQKVKISSIPIPNQQVVLKNQSLNIQNSDQIFIYPPNIIKEGNIFTQSNYGAGKGLGCLNIKFSQFTGKIKIKILSLKLGAKITFGVVDFNTFTSSNYTFDQNNNKFYWFDTQGKTKAVNYNYITNLSEGSTLDALIKKNHCRVTCKGNMCDIQLHDKKEQVFFYNLQGNCQIQLSYTNFKQ